MFYDNAIKNQKIWGSNLSPILLREAVNIQNLTKFLANVMKISISI